MIHDNWGSMQKFMAGILASILAYLDPITGDLKSLVAIFFINFLFGLLDGLITKRESFNFKKAFHCIAEAMTFFLLISCIYYIGKNTGQKSAALQCISFVTYSVFYYYGVNILRNLTTLFSNGRAHKCFAFLYWVMSIEFIKGVPLLSTYLKNEKQ